MSPCPWCGGAAKIVSMLVGDEMVFKAACHSCFANGPAADSDRTAKLLWERVAGPKTPKARA